MNYFKWLQKNGFSEAIQNRSLSEVEVNKLALPLNDPGSEKMKSIERIVIHHSATRTGNAACFRALHRAVNGWNDIGYHYVIGNGTDSRDGEIEEGRRIPFVGAHARGANEDSIGICLVGNFNIRRPSVRQISSLLELIRKLQKSYILGNEDVTIHKLVKGSSTECPGSKFDLKKFLFLLNNNNLQ